MARISQRITVTISLVKGTCLPGNESELNRAILFDMASCCDPEREVLVYCSNSLEMESKADLQLSEGVELFRCAVVPDDHAVACLDDRMRAMR